MATNAAAIAMAMMNSEGGGSGGDVTKKYVDDHLALKANKTETAEYPIASTTTGINPSITDSADGFVQDMKVYGESRVSKNLFDKTKVIANRRVSTSNGGMYVSDDWSAVDPRIDIEPNTNYVLTTGDDAISYAAFYQADDTFISGLSWTPGTSRTSPANAYKVRFDFPSANINLVQLEKGETPTPYEPYFSGIHGIGDSGSLTITTTNSDSTESSTATLTTGIPLYAVGDVKDELDEKKGVVIKRCGKVVLTGNEYWWLSPDVTVVNNSKSIMAPYLSIMPASNISKYEAVGICDILTYNSQHNVISGGEYGISIVGARADIRINGITTVEDLKTYLVSNPVTVVYELAEPYEILLTSAELSALRNLRTFDSMTNVIITDDPTVDISYLLDTNNGQAVADVQTGLQGQISNIPAWITDIPENHKSIYRGKYLGNSVSAAQLAAIADGSFDDLYVGDYWEIPVTIDGTTVSNKWRIADFDYFLHNGTDKHHAVIVPDNTLYTDQMGGNISYGYYQSAMFTTNLNKGRTAIADAFPDMVISYECYDIINSTVTKYDCTAELMALSSLTGVYSDYIHANYLPVLPQMSLFRIMPDFIGANPNGSGHDAGFLTQTVKTSSFYWAISTRMQMMEMRTSDSYGVRPFFLLGDAGT